MVWTIDRIFLNTSYSKIQILKYFQSFQQVEKYLVIGKEFGNDF